MLLMVDGNGFAYQRSKTSSTTWAAWIVIANGSFTRITGLNYEGTVYAAMIDDEGQIWRTSRGPSGFSNLIKQGNPSGVTAWKDIDMTWDEFARGFMLAVPENGGNELYFLPMYGDSPWTWHYFTTHLWAPSASINIASPKLESITASRWIEDPAGTTSPVVFATDNQGSIYLIEYQRVLEQPGWILDWKAFYHEKIVYADNGLDSPDCVSDADCDNGAFCDGTETCKNGVCFDATNKNPCGDDTCDEDTNQCIEKCSNVFCFIFQVIQVIFCFLTFNFFC